MGKGSDIVVGREGDSLTGKVLEKHFEIKSALGRLKVATKEIAWIRFKNPPKLKQDEITLLAGDMVGGRILQKHVRFKADTGDTLTLSRDSILTLIVGGRTRRGGKSLLSG